MSENTVWAIMMVCVTVMILGITVAIYDYNIRWSAQQKELQSSCIAAGGTVMPRFGETICIAPHLK